MRIATCALLLCLASSMAGSPVAAQEETSAPADRSVLDAQVQELRREVVDLNRDLFLLEEDLLFPASTQVAVFVSMDIGTFFALDSVQIKFDDKEVANYLYTERELEALKRGGVHRIWLGNLKAGEHELVAFFTGKGTHERDYKRGATLSVEKRVGAKYVELKISDRLRKLQPEFVVRVWE
ncbi:MAG: AraC family transcriptional regulator [Steroidobacteraceae bacterium]